MYIHTHTFSPSRVKNKARPSTLISSTQHFSCPFYNLQQHSRMPINNILHGQTYNDLFLSFLFFPEQHHSWSLNSARRNYLLSRHAAHHTLDLVFALTLGIVFILSCVISSFLALMPSHFLVNSFVFMEHILQWLRKSEWEVKFLRPCIFENVIILL